MDVPLAELRGTPICALAYGSRVVVSTDASTLFFYRRQDFAFIQAVRLDCVVESVFLVGDNVLMLHSSEAQRLLSIPADGLAHEAVFIASDVRFARKGTDSSFAVLNSKQIVVIYGLVNGDVRITHTTKALNHGDVADFAISARGDVAFVTSSGECFLNSSHKLPLVGMCVTSYHNVFYFAIKQGLVVGVDSDDATPVGNPLVLQHTAAVVKLFVEDDHKIVATRNDDSVEILKYPNAQASAAAESRVCDGVYVLGVQSGEELIISHDGIIHTHVPIVDVQQLCVEFEKACETASAANAWTARATITQNTDLEFLSKVFICLVAERHNITAAFEAIRLSPLRSRFATDLLGYFPQLPGQTRVPSPLKLFSKQDLVSHEAHQLDIHLLCEKNEKKYFSVLEKMAECVDGVAYAQICVLLRRVDELDEWLSAQATATEAAQVCERISPCSGEFLGILKKYVCIDDLVVRLCTEKSYTDALEMLDDDDDAWAKHGESIASAMGPTPTLLSHVPTSIEDFEKYPTLAFCSKIAAGDWTSVLSHPMLVLRYEDAVFEAALTSDTQLPDINMGAEKLKALRSLQFGDLRACARTCAVLGLDVTRFNSAALNEVAFNAMLVGDTDTAAPETQIESSLSAALEFARRARLPATYVSKALPPHASSSIACAYFASQLAHSDANLRLSKASLIEACAELQRDIIKLSHESVLVVDDVCACGLPLFGFSLVRDATGGLMHEHCVPTPEA